MKRRRIRFDAVGLILPALVLLLWFAVTAWGGMPEYKLPSPQKLLYVLADVATGRLGITPF